VLALRRPRVTVAGPALRCAPLARPFRAVNIDEVKALHAQFLSLKGAEAPVEGAALSLK
jgi:hypothetical protein